MPPNPPLLITRIWSPGITLSTNASTNASISLNTLAGIPLACVTCKGRSHPVFGIWSLSLEENLREALDSGIRKVDEWTNEMGVAEKAFRAPGGMDPFFNINTPEDLAIAEKMVDKLK